MLKRSALVAQYKIYESKFSREDISNSRNTHYWSGLCYKNSSFSNNIFVNV